MSETYGCSILSKLTESVFTIVNSMAHLSPVNADVLMYTRWIDIIHPHV